MKISFKLYKYLKDNTITSRQLVTIIKFFKFLPRECITDEHYMGKYDEYIDPASIAKALVLQYGIYSQCFYVYQDGTCLFGSIPQMAKTIRRRFTANQFIYLPEEFLEAMRENPL